MHRVPAYLPMETPTCQALTSHRNIPNDPSPNFVPSLYQPHTYMRQTQQQDTV